MPTRTDDDPERLWQSGAIAAACSASARRIANAPRIEHPFRDSAVAAEVADQWHSHGTWCWYDARFDDADAALSRAYAMRCELRGAEHADALDTLERLAAVAHRRREFVLATQRFESVIAGVAKLHGDDSVRVAIARRNYAACLRDRMKLPEARALLDKAGDVLDRALPAEHPERVAALKVEALQFVWEGSYPAAVRVAERAVELGRRAWADDHPFVAGAELTLALAEIKLDELRKADKRLARVLKIFDKKLRPAHPLIAVALLRQAQLVHRDKHGSLERAEELARRSLAIVRETLPKVTGDFTWTLFQILMDAGKPVDAAELATRIDPDLEIDMRLELAARLSNRFLQVGDYKTALPWLSRACEACGDDAELRAEWTAELDKWTRYVKRFEDERD